MKSNVDLTEDRDFRKNAGRRPSALSFKIPKINSIVEDFGGMNQTGLIDTGGYKERLSKKLFQDLEGGKICERCGREIRWFASEELTLCADCLNDLESEVTGSNWVFKNER